MEYKNTLIYKRYWSFEAQDMRRRSDTLPACSSPVRALRTYRRDRHVPLLVLYISMSSEDNQSQRGVVLSADPHNVNPRGRLVQRAASGAVRPPPTWHNASWLRSTSFLCILLRVRPGRRHPSVPAARDVRANARAACSRSPSCCLSSILDLQAVTSPFLTHPSSHLTLAARLGSWDSRSARCPRSGAVQYAAFISSPPLSFLAFATEHGNWMHIPLAASTLSTPS
ncbi:hypothetical protein B0H13DRAFT_2056882, partial [Mycena leptocephala]